MRRPPLVKTVPSARTVPRGNAVDSGGFGVVGTTVSDRTAGLAFEHSGALGYTVDLALEERRVALMLGGPAQYAPLPRADGTHAPTTATRLAWRQLSAAGWTVVPIPWQEWDVLDSPLARREYLTERVREATAEPEAEQPEAMADSG